MLLGNQNNRIENRTNEHPCLFVDTLGEPKGLLIKHADKSHFESYQFPDPLQDLINMLFTDGVVTTCIVVGGIFLAGNQLLRVEELPIGAGPNFI